MLGPSCLHLRHKALPRFPISFAGLRQLCAGPAVPGTGSFHAGRGEPARAPEGDGRGPTCGIECALVPCGSILLDLEVDVFWALLAWQSMLPPLWPLASWVERSALNEDLSY